MHNLSQLVHLYRYLCIRCQCLITKGEDERSHLRRLHELQGVDVGVFELETEADGLAGQGLQVALSFPDNDAIDLVADNLLAIGISIH